MEVGGKMNKRKDRQSVIINVVILAAILIFVNLVSLRMFHRFDFSQGKIYTLTKSSKNTVKKLDDLIMVKAYFTKNLPGQYAEIRRYTEDILSEYHAYSKGKFKFEFIDPVDDETLKIEAKQNRIQPLRMQIVENDKLEIREVYMGLVFNYQGKAESLPVIQNTQSLEYDLTRLIKKITAVGLTKVALFTNEPEIPEELRQQYGNQLPESQFRVLTQLVQNTYELSKTDLSEPLSDEIELLIMTGVTDSLSNDQLYNFDQYMMKKGKLVLMQETINAELQEQKADVIKSNFLDLISSYGIKIKPNLVLSANCGRISVQQNSGFFKQVIPVNYPFFPIVSNVNKAHIVSQKIEQLQFIFTSEIDTTNTLGLNMTPLVWTDQFSEEMRAPRFNLGYQDYMNKILRQEFNTYPRLLSANYKGKIVSSFSSTASSNPEFIGNNDNAEIILISDSDFMNDNSGGGIPGNRDYFLNSVDFLAADPTLIQIRNREIAFHPLDEISAPMKKVVKWLNVLLPALLLIFTGLIKFRNEKIKRKLLREMYE
jgi:gliding-associated putative ABC transporter substrate-binding component GldG